MSTLVAFITSRVGLALGGCLLLVVAVISSANWSITHRDLVREQQRAEGLYAQIHDPTDGLSARWTLCKASLAGTQGALQRQNQAVDDMAKAMIERTAQAQAAVDAAQARYLVAQQQANALLFAQPKPGETRCDAAERLILEQIR